MHQNAGNCIYIFQNFLGEKFQTPRQNVPPTLKMLLTPLVVCVCVCVNECGVYVCARMNVVCMCVCEYIILHLCVCVCVCEYIILHLCVCVCVCLCMIVSCTCVYGCVGVSI